MMRALIVVLVWLCAASAAHAIELKRGLSAEPWTTWPDETGFSEPGFLDVFPEWRKTAGIAELKSMKAAGFDFVRFGVDPTVFMWKPNPAKTKRLLAEVAKRLDEFEAAGLNVIVDLHIVPTNGYRKLGTDTVLKNGRAFAKYLGVVEAIGTAIAGRDPARVAFEPFNEPTIDCDGAPRWPAMAKDLHRVARKAAPRLAIVMQGACWGGDKGLAALDPSSFADDNIVWSFHSYDPFIVTHQGASWTNDVVRYVADLRYPPSLMPEEARRRVIADAAARIAKSGESKRRKKELLADLEDNMTDYFAAGHAEAALARPFDTAAAWAKRHGIPPGRILLGEFGAIRKDETAELPPEIRANIVAAIRQAAEDRGFAWAVWSWSGSFSITKGEPVGAFEPQLLRALGLTAK